MRFVADSRNIKATRSIKNASNATRRGIRQGFYFAGRDLMKDAKGFILRGPKTGKVYKIAGRKRRHRSSAPGESPSNLTGALRRSVDFVVQGSDEMEFGAGTEYAAAQELGYAKRNLEARPYLIRSIDANERNIENHFEREIRKELESK